MDFSLKGFRLNIIRNCYNLLASSAPPPYLFSTKKDEYILCNGDFVYVGKHKRLCSLSQPLTQG